MDCERPGCGHPLNLHDPCAARGCECGSYEPADRKARAAMITDTLAPPPRTKAAATAAERLRIEQARQAETRLQRLLR